ncbi:MAG TPA: acetate--CoA ligase family protein [Methylomirabilota bacterium]|nr:acetate--CoA ligase family protein [Methylomirabilota bacterium]
MNDSAARTDETLRARRLANLRRLLKPRHVAFVGGKGLAGPIKGCLAGGFTGQIWPVHPSYPEIGGIACHPSIDALPEAPDAAYIAAPREATVEIVRALARRGAGGCVCYAAGFAEVGPEGAALQRALVEATGDLALVGPISYGVLNYIDGVTMFASGPGGARTERGAAFVSQSGNIALTLTMNQRSVPFAYVISAGAQAVLSLADYVDALADDPRVTAISLYIEGLNDIPAFARAALKAIDKGKPVIALKVGRSELGARLAMSHTSSLAGSDKLYDTLFERLGIIRVATLPALLETIKMVSVPRQLTGDRLAIFTCSGGDSLMAADRAAEIGLTLPQFVPAQYASLRAQLPAFATVSNPLDYNLSLWGDQPGLTRCFGTTLSEGFDAGMLVLDYPPNDPQGFVDCDKSVNALLAAAQTHGVQPIVCTTIQETLPEATRRRLTEAGCPAMQGLEDALDAFRAATRQSQRIAEIRAGTATAALPEMRSPRDEPRLLPERDAKLALEKYGVRIPDARLVDVGAGLRPAPTVAAEMAAEIGFPVVAKVAAPALAHKTEAGAVSLNLRSGDAVKAAIDGMSAQLARYKPGLKAERFLVEKQMTNAVAELIVGVKRDAGFGLVLVVGAGGILVEMVQDAASLLLPTDRAEVERAIRGLKVAKLLAGYRGRPAGDIEGVIDAVMAIAGFAEAHRHRLAELDVNPLLVLPEGQGAVAVDALIVMSPD